MVCPYLGSLCAVACGTHPFGQAALSVFVRSGPGRRVQRRCCSQHIGPQAKGKLKEKKTGNNGAFSAGIIGNTAFHAYVGTLGILFLQNANANIPSNNLAREKINYFAISRVVK